MAETFSIIRKKPAQTHLTRSGVEVFAFDTLDEESWEKTAQVTRHPVETGFSVADHIQREPEKLSLKGTISRTPLGFAILQANRDAAALEALAAIMEAGEPVSVVTGLRVYENMALVSISNTRDASSGQAVAPMLRFEQIVYAYAETVVIPSSLLGRRRWRGSKKKKGRKAASSANADGSEASDKTAKNAAAAENRKEAEGAGREKSVLADILD